MWRRNQLFVSALSLPEAIEPGHKGVRMERQQTSGTFLKPADIQMLQRVPQTTLPVGASPREREAHAATLVTLFKSGLTSEDKLVSAVTGSPGA